jgi:hypothetical protein
LRIPLENDQNTTVNAFHTVDGDAIEWRNRWGGGGIELSYRASQALSQAQRSLVSKQDERSITLVREKFPESKMTMVPYVSFFEPVVLY